MEIEKEVWKSVLQILMFQPVMELKNVTELLSELNDRRTVAVDLDSVIHQINRHVNRHGQQLTKQICEITENEYLILFSTSNNAAIQTLTGGYTKEHREVYKRILAEIMTSETLGCVSSTHVLNMSQDMPFHITKGHLQDIAEKLINDGWFCKKEGKIYIGVRTIAEMAPYIAEAYADCVSNCHLCKDYVFVGIVCECGVVCHKRCVDKMRKILSGVYECPKCKVQQQI
ncbi:non-structural maintenance of chromosomes element 1 homolog [Schistocerca americana]|uniref:non-structural maintenance of chromosomes element 1 homolog n=1 Tax=Schistocerca americana TaxID=7009 RepID=UPI001F4F7055|nr:non-structural maintenance of chromosomes element 1 homolog [Schistocerca americana]XP_046979453.1 non-structural maintenance of chromosomes element 1 homolog [Schistocerca americana]XP_046979454.1 non-structural maintenance of chromosomes element 1 homolog [Schistocerca americana]XP_046979455.1 non-structural maintenance of chromosomes element 1 homolog [Schistocerca americana]XP_047097446.1 non-structural maintenance of chromosomes element 1 homolog isoform X1 [Schistocerca piceifrons]XP_